MAGSLEPGSHDHCKGEFGGEHERGGHGVEYSLKSERALPS
jgi:hypothetical protein